MRVKSVKRLRASPRRVREAAVFPCHSTQQAPVADVARSPVATRVRRPARPATEGAHTGAPDDGARTTL